MAASANAVWAEDEHDELPPLPQMLARGKQSRAAKAAERGTAAKGSLSYTEWCKFMTQEEARIHCETVIATAQPIEIKSKRKSRRAPRVGYDSEDWHADKAANRERLAEASRGQPAPSNGGVGGGHAGTAGMASTPAPPKSTRIIATAVPLDPMAIRDQSKNFGLTSLQSAMLNSTYEDFMEIMAERNIGHKKQLKYQDQWVQLHRSCQPGCACECQVEGVPALEQRRRYEERLAGGAAAPAAAPTASLQALSLSDLSGRGLSPAARPFVPGSVFFTPDLRDDQSEAGFSEASFFTNRWLPGGGFD